MKKPALIPVVVLGIAIGAVYISTQTTFFQETFGSITAAYAGSKSTNAGTTGDKVMNTETEEPSVTAMAQASGQSEFQQFLHNNAASRTILNKGGISYVTNPSSPLVLVNKKRQLDEGYIPNDLIKAEVAFSFSGDNPKQQMRKVAAEALEKLFAGAKKDGIELKAVSGYRSYASQKSIFSAYAAKHGEQEANTFSAHPGQSEHQTGLAMDVSSASVHYGLETSYGETKEGKWLKAHAADYGFIVRYEQGKEKETGYMYEPWHVRYVGIFVAEDIQKLGLTLEAYLDRF